MSVSVKDEKFGRAGEVVRKKFGCVPGFKHELTQLSKTLSSGSEVAGCCLGFQARVIVSRRSEFTSRLYKDGKILLMLGMSLVFSVGVQKPLRLYESQGSGKGEFGVLSRYG